MCVCMISFLASDGSWYGEQSRGDIRSILRGAVSIELPLASGLFAQMDHNVLEACYPDGVIPESWQFPCMVHGVSIVKSGLVG